MKKLKYLSLLILIFTIVSCSNNHSSGSSGSGSSGSSYSSSSSSSSDEDDYQEILDAMEELAEEAGQDLANCCSTFGYNNLSTYVLEDECSYNDITETLKICMKVSWKGSISGSTYWIKGYLKIDMESGGRSWQKISDSGGFSPGCSRGCIY